MNRTDNFTRANDPTGLGTPSDAGTPWVSQTTGWTINSNLATSTNQGADILATLDASATDGTAEITVGAVATAIGVACRVQDAGNHYRVIFAGGTFYLESIIGGGGSVLSSAGGTLTTGDTLSLDCTGNVLTVAKNGSTILTSTDSTFTTQTLFGIVADPNAGNTASLFTITTGSPPPPTSTQGLLNAQLTYWVYRPATMSALSKLTIWTTPRNILLYDTQADAALTWLQSNTPAALQF